MRKNDIGLFCDILLKVWKDGDCYYGSYLERDGFFENDGNATAYDKARNKLAEYGSIVSLHDYNINGITVKNGIAQLENTDEGVVLEDGFVFATPHLYEPYILIEADDTPRPIQLI